MVIAGETAGDTLFQRIRADQHLRDFLGPRILESLFVVGTENSLPFYRELLTAGFTHRDPMRCEIAHALVMVRRLTGVIEPNAKYRDVERAQVTEALDRAEEAFRQACESFTPVSVI